MQPVHLMRQPGAGVAVEPVGDHQHDRALAEHAARPQPVELGDAGADAGAAGPVGDHLGDPVERQIDVAVAEIAGDVGQPRAEHERVDPVAVIRDRVHEMQEQAAVAAHRAGDVAQHDERRRATPSALAAQLYEATRTQRGAQGRAHIGAGAPRVAGKASRRNVHDRQLQPRDRGLGAGQLLQ